MYWLWLCISICMGLDRGCNSSESPNKSAKIDRSCVVIHIVRENGLSKVPCRVDFLFGVERLTLDCKVQNTLSERISTANSMPTHPGARLSRQLPPHLSCLV